MPVNPDEVRRSIRWGNGMNMTSRRSLRLGAQNTRFGLLRGKLPMGASLIKRTADELKSRDIKARMRKGGNAIEVQLGGEELRQVKEIVEDHQNRIVFEGELDITMTTCQRPSGPVLRMAFTKEGLQQAGCCETCKEGGAGHLK